MQGETDWSLHPDWEAIQRLKITEFERKRRQGENFLPYVSNKALKKEMKRRIAAARQEA
jgi:hypothetical protein|tara:strand:- start:1 stop:177 length:177 start_codon:yes stop_codon:yes gene_type:complete